MREFKYTSYHTEYACEGDYNYSTSGDACFREVFYNVYSNSHLFYHIILYRGVEYVTKTQHSNACLFTKSKVIQHLRQAQALYPFVFKVEESSRHNYPIFIIHLELNNVPRLFHKYLLSWIRYLYEFPYNVLLLDAKRLKKDPAFKFIPTPDAFNVVATSFPDYYGTGHGIAYRYSQKLTRAQLKERISKVSTLNAIYQLLNAEAREHWEKIPEYIGSFTTDDIEYWSEEYFEKYRKPIYLRNEDESIRGRRQ